MTVTTGWRSSKTSKGHFEGSLFSLSVLFFGAVHPPTVQPESVCWSLVGEKKWNDFADCEMLNVLVSLTVSWLWTQRDVWLVETPDQTTEWLIEENHQQMTVFLSAPNQTRETWRLLLQKKTPADRKDSVTSSRNVWGTQADTRRHTRPCCSSLWPGLTFWQETVKRCVSWRPWPLSGPETNARRRGNLIWGHQSRHDTSWSLISVSLLWRRVSGETATGDWFMQRTAFVLEFGRGGGSSDLSFLEHLTELN